jgi:predicted ATPase/GAF domain-containing protein/tRNA A-37 threonylcarbamoyl transferase component Bud32
MTLVLPNYEVIEQVYQGSNTVIHRGRRLSDNAPVMFKTLRSEHPTPRQISGLRHEYEIMKNLNLDGVVKTYELLPFGEGLALVLEDFGGRPLSSIIQSRRLDIAGALEIIITLAHTLGQLHEQGILHKDIKPQNILYNAQLGTTKLIDFGIASRLSQDGQLASNNKVIEGTLAYMSPEQTGRMNRLVDYRSDFYSLGVTFYELLTGQLPFNSTDSMELIHSHIARTPATPHELQPTIPLLISNIVMKLMAKASEDRYQSSQGLKVDLEKALLSWKAHGKIDNFELGLYDNSGVLRISQRLYGRDQDIATLLQAFDRVSDNGTNELLLVSGYSGIGKTALVNEVHKPIARQRGYFVAGKFDQYRRNIPYTALIQAFQDLIRQVFGEESERVDQFKVALSDALGGNGQVLISVIPELEQIIGPQPEVEQLGPSETRTRFINTLLQFVNVFAKAEHPLALFLDDLQWADLASLQFIQALLTGESSKYVLLIGAYRDNEVTTSHPLMLTVDALKRDQAIINSIVLKPLSLGDINLWLADSLNQQPPQTLEFATLIEEKTAGNPFFMNQFVRSLHRDHLLSYQQDTWVWDLEQIKSAEITDNVVELMAGNIRKLSPETQSVLQLAACIGNNFDLGLLSVISEKTQIETARILWSAIEAGLLIPLDADYRLLATEDPALLNELAATELRVSYKFLHDRVQQAAYALLSEEDTKHVHLKIGRLLLQHAGDEIGDQIFDIANQFNMGIELVDDAEERLKLAKLNLVAGKKARASAAYAAAVGYLTTSQELLPDNYWQDYYELSAEVFQERSTCEYLISSVSTAEMLFDEQLANLRSDLERVEVYITRTSLYTSLGRFADALETGLQGLALLGISFPSTPEEIGAAVPAALGLIQQNLGDKTVGDLLEAPEMSDANKKAAMRLMAQLITPSFNVNTMVYMLIVLEMANTSLQYGNGEGSAFAYCTYGMILSSMFGDYERAESFGRLGIDLSERERNAELRYRSYNTFGGFIDHWRNPIRNSTKYIRQAYLDCVGAGDIGFAGFPAMGIIINDLGSGVALNEVLDQNKIYLEFLRRSKNTGLEEVFVLFQQVIYNLRGQTSSVTSLSDDMFSEDEFVTNLAQSSLTSVASYYVYKAQVLYLHEAYQEAYEISKQAEQMKPVLGGVYTGNEQVFYSSLIRSAVYPSLPEEEKQACWEVLEQNLAQMKLWAEHSAENSGSRYALMAAEMARLANDDLQAQELYDEAIASAHENGFIHTKAIANELAARFYLARGKRTFGRAYMLEAYEQYLEWGALAKARLLTETASGLIGTTVARPSSTTSHLITQGSSSLVTMHHHAGMLDVTAVIKGAQVIAGEIMLDKLLDKLMTIVVENAGAQRGALILSHDDQLKIEVILDTAKNGSCEHVGSIVGESSNAVCAAIVQYTARTLESVVLHDATQENRFTNDLYIVRNRPKSILCLPLIHQGTLTGVLYLENNLATHVFNAERVELLGLLSLQGAIAIENALLYADVQKISQTLQETNEELENTNRSLEEMVAARTEELSQTNERLQLELIERLRLDDERTRLQEQIIQVQAMTLAELSTPLIPLTDKIVAMPLIGTVDSQRAQQVLETLLDGVNKIQAQAVIIDITGMSVVDTAVAGTLIRASQAVRLLGAQTIITGIRPEVAQTLVGLGIDMNGVITLSTFQAGIAYALSKSGEGTIYQKQSNSTVKKLVV